MKARLLLWWNTYPNRQFFTAMAFMLIIIGGFVLVMIGGLILGSLIF